nr:unnamed protein product [Leishmania braziliensis]
MSGSAVPTKSARYVAAATGLWTWSLPLRHGKGGKGGPGEGRSHAAVCLPDWQCCRPTVTPSLASLRPSLPPMPPRGGASSPCGTAQKGYMRIHHAALC